MLCGDEESFILNKLWVVQGRRLRSFPSCVCKWIEVPRSTIEYRALLGDSGETGGGPWCGMVHLPNVGVFYLTRCAILPPQSASAQDEP
jgi:hypothetical protein